jgi:predicted HTH transcriptional regulator
VLDNIGAAKEETPNSFVSDNTEPATAKTSVRQEKILEFLNNNGKAQVMDLQTILPDITKRTIRRDLDELLESGKIIRLGEFNQVFYKIA